MVSRTPYDVLRQYDPGDVDGMELGEAEPGAESEDMEGNGQEEARGDTKGGAGKGGGDSGGGGSHRNVTINDPE